MELLAGKKALVTGGGRGIGKAISEGLAAHGADVAIVEIDEAAAKGAAAEIADKTGKRILAVRADVSSKEDVEKAVRFSAESFGGLDIVVNNAGICNLKFEPDFLDIPDEAWNRTMDINLRSVLYFAKAARSYMAANGFGRIINISSQSGKDGGQRVSPEYSASKAGVIILTKRLCVELGKYGITVNSVSPGTIVTEMTRDMDLTTEIIPVGAPGKPEDVANAVVFLASEMANYISGVNLDVTGGAYMD